MEVAFTDADLDLAESSPAREAGLGDLRRRTGNPPAVIVRMRQVHGDTVHVVGPGDLDAAEPPEADALVTAERGVGLLTRVADCVPVVLADPARGVLGAVHSGRRGTALGVAAAAVEAMRALGAEEVVAWIGPAICGSCYEVPAAMQAEIADRVPEAVATTRWGTPGLDLRAGVAAQLTAAGCRVHRAPAVPLCTYEDARLPSHRRDATAVRCAGLIWSDVA